MKTYTTSRLATGNTVFPSTITLASTGITISDPSFFSGEESTTLYSKIATVKINCPFIGYSDVIIDITGADQLIIHGFTADQAKEIKSEILKKLISKPTI